MVVGRGAGASSWSQGGRSNIKSDQLMSALHDVVVEQRGNVLLAGDDTPSLDRFGKALLTSLRGVESLEVSVLFDMSRELLVERFNRLVETLSIDQARMQRRQGAQAQVWFLQVQAPAEVAQAQLLIRLTQDFPGAGVSLVLLAPEASAMQLTGAAGTSRLATWRLSSQPAPESTAKSPTAPLAPVPPARTDRPPAPAASVLPMPVRAGMPRWLAWVALALVCVAGAGVSWIVAAPHFGLSLPPFIAGSRTPPTVAAPEDSGAVGQTAGAPASTGSESSEPASARPTGPDATAEPAASAAPFAERPQDAQPASAAARSETPAPAPAAAPAQAPAPTASPAPVPAVAMPGPAVPAASAGAADASGASVPSAAAAPPSKAEDRAKPAATALQDAARWALELPPKAWMIQHMSLDSAEVARVWRARSPALSGSRILASLRRPSRQRHYVVVSGPFETVAAAREFLDRPGMPKETNAWIRRAVDLQSDLDRGILPAEN